LKVGLWTGPPIVIVFGLPGRGKTHFLAALGRELILRHSKQVLFAPAFKIVGRLLAAVIDRLVHHSIILEFDGPSQRIQKATGPDKIKESGKTSPGSKGKGS